MRLVKTWQEESGSQWERKDPRPQDTVHEDCPLLSAWDGPLGPLKWGLSELQISSWQLIKIHRHRHFYL